MPRLLPNHDRQGNARLAPIQMLWLGFVTVLAVICLMLHRNPATAVHAATATQPHLQDPDRACARCHAAIYASYQQTSMARGSGLATEALHAGTFTHTPSGVSYRVDQKDSIARLRSTRTGDDRLLDDAEQLSYFIGSGKHGRTYLFSRAQPGTGAKLWYEAPVNWYTRRGRYDMAPAFDNAVTAPLALPTDANCLHCHATAIQQPLPTAQNAFPDQPFAQAGIGCAACHGDATAHLQTQGKTPPLQLASLTPAKRDSICLQCHLEGDAMVQRTGKSLSRFQPGDDLADTAIYFVNASSPKSAGRASSQYEGLLRSACRRAVGDRLTCTTCHDPHSTPAPEQRVAFYRARCLQCHGGFAGATAAMQQTPVKASEPQSISERAALPAPVAKPFNPATHHPGQPDCAACHMPSRATSDISHEQNVDHDIEARPNSPQTAPALALRSLDAPASARFTHAVDLVAVGTAQPTDRETGIAYAQFAARGDRESYIRAATLLRKVNQNGNADAVVHEQLAYLAQIAHDSKTARTEYLAALGQSPNNPTALSNLAVLEAQSGDTASAIRHLQTVATNDPGQTAAVLNLAMLQCRSGDPKQTKLLLQLALRFNPDSPEARHFLNAGDYAGTHCVIH